MLCANSSCNILYATFVQLFESCLPAHMRHLPPSTSRATSAQFLWSATLQIKVEKDLIPNTKQAKRAHAPAGSKQPLASGKSPSPAAAAAAGDWTEAQQAALQKAYLTVKPSQRNFWQHVAKMVPGKTALECCNCKFDEMPTPVEGLKHSSRLAAAAESSPVRPPALKVTGGEQSCIARIWM